MARSLMPVAEALERVLAGVKPLPADSVPLEQAHGRVLAQDLAAQRTQPPADVSAMDGYAVRGIDASKPNATFKVIGEVAAGHPFAGEIGAGEAARIFTGGVLPSGADTVVIQELVTRIGDTMTLTKPSEPGRHVRRAGYDFRRGDVLLRKGKRLTDRDLMLAAAMNYPAVPAHRRPRVAIFGTGDELIMPGAEPGPGQIVYSNGFALAALLRADGAEVTEMGPVADRIADIRGAIRRAREEHANILLTTGGASVGDHDLVQKALVEEGMALSFWRIAMRPGRPMMHGRLGDMQVIGVPGNPVSSYVCSLLFALPLNRTLSGRNDVHPVPLPAKLGRDLPENDERADYLRARLTHEPQGLVATPVTAQDSSLMAFLAQADCLILREPYAAPAKAGSEVVILKLPL